MAVVASTVLGVVGLLVGLVALVFAVTAPLTGCLVGGGGFTCGTDGVALVDGVIRWLGVLVLLYSGVVLVVDPWR